VRLEQPAPLESPGRQAPLVALERREQLDLLELQVPPVARARLERLAFPEQPVSPDRPVSQAQLGQQAQRV
jgi:hypothetical protein